MHYSSIDFTFCWLNFHLRNFSKHWIAVDIADWLINKFNVAINIRDFLIIKNKSTQIILTLVFVVAFDPHLI
jgi:hypothetical protein